MPVPFITLLTGLLIVQGVIGAIDTLINHELIARLPYRVEAKREVGIHVLRESVYGALFVAMAWFAWHGAWALLPGILLVLALVIDAVDEFVENRTRVLPQNERMLHFALVLNMGIISILMLFVLADWYRQPSALLRVDYRMMSLALSGIAAAAFLWALRDFFAWRRLQKPT